MTFYNALQMDPAILKAKIAQCDTPAEKRFYWFAMALRSLLIVGFAVVFISGLAKVFGQDNTPLAVALFCILLGIRFVNFEYCMGDSLVTLGAALAIFLFTPTAVAVAPPYLAIPLHFVSFFLLLYMTTQKPELGNGGLYSFAYVYLTGNPVFGETLAKRTMMAVVGYLLCAIILYRKHRHAHGEVRFHHVLQRFDLRNIVHLWQFRMALGVSLVLTAGRFFGVERFMWMGFACASLLCEYPYSDSVTTRFWQRIIGVFAGSGAYLVIYLITPDSLHFLLGPLGGLCLGFCRDYRYKTAFNCFGALMLATGIYGLGNAVVLRITDTILGVLFALVFTFLFQKLASQRIRGNACKESRSSTVIYPALRIWSSTTLRRPRERSL